MNSIRNTVSAVVAAAALSLLAACGNLEAPVEDIGNAVEQSVDSPAPKQPVRTNPGRLDFGDGEATLPAKPKPSIDDNPSRLDFGDNGRG